MSSAPAIAEPPMVEHLSLEGRLFRASPFGTATTSALIFAFGAGAFLLIAALVHYPLFTATGMTLGRTVPGFVSPLLLATALGLNRYADTKQVAEIPVFASIATSGTVPAAALFGPVSPEHRGLASLVGVAIGLAVAYFSVPTAVLRDYPTIYAWQCGLIVLLCILFMRGAVMTVRSRRQLQWLIEHAVRIDLLHVDRLSVIGRQTARSALIWFSTAAIVCLYFVGGDIGFTTFPLLLACAGLGLWIFLHPMSGVHDRIRRAKVAELDRVRDEIEAASRQEAHDPHAAARLPGLIAYEARIQAVREWPFDQSTLIRVATYVLIPAIPWFGEAIASEVLQRLAH
jgi:hypothetical protein